MFLQPLVTLISPLGLPNIYQSTKLTKYPSTIHLSSIQPSIHIKHHKTSQFLSLIDFDFWIFG